MDLINLKNEKNSKKYLMYISVFYMYIIFNN